MNNQSNHCTYTLPGNRIIISDAEPTVLKDGPKLLIFPGSVSSYEIDNVVVYRVKESPDLCVYLEDSYDFNIDVLSTYGPSKLEQGMFFDIDGNSPTTMLRAANGKTVYLLFITKGPKSVINIEHMSCEIIPLKERDNSTNKCYKEQEGIIGEYKRHCMEMEKTLRHLAEKNT